MKSIKRLNYSMPLVCLASLGGALGCATDVRRGSEELGQVEQSFTAYEQINTWTMPLEVCFKKNSSISPGDYSLGKTEVQSALEGSWENVPGIEFDFSGDCPTSFDANAILAIELTIAHGWGQCGAGPGSSCTVGRAAGVLSQAQLDVLVATATHEVGHALGQAHEHVRPDADPLCEWEQGILDGCTDCQDGTCSLENYDLCWFRNDGTTDDPVFVSAGDMANAANRVSQRTPNPVLNPVTEKDHDDSIMDYCSAANGPSGLDYLGMEMLYPGDDYLPFACADGCMGTGDGVILREDGSARDSWSARGALDWWDSNGIRWTPELMQNPFALGEQLQASWMTTNSDDLFYWSISRFTGEMIIGEGHVEVSDAKWTAVAMAVL